MSELILFVFTFIMVLVIYELFIVKKAKKRYFDNKGHNDKEVLEVLYLKKIYNLDMDKISYPQLVQIIAFTSSFDISIIVTIINLLSNFILQVIVGFICVFVIIFFSYHLVYLFYKKKGMIINGK